MLNLSLLNSNKNVLAALLIFLALNHIGLAQDATSFYFSEALPVGMKSVKEFPAKLQGEYFNEKDTLVKLIITSENIQVKHSILVVAKESDLLKKPGIKIDGELIFGLIPGEGVPFVKEKDTIYTAIFQKDIFFKMDSHNEAKIQKNIIILNFKESNEDLYTVLVIKFEGKKLNILELDADKNLTFLNSKLIIDVSSSNGISKNIAKPNKKDFDVLLKEGVFLSGASYFKR